MKSAGRSPWLIALVGSLVLLPIFMVLLQPRPSSPIENFETSATSEPDEAREEPETGKPVRLSKADLEAQMRQILTAVTDPGEITAQMARLTDLADFQDPEVGPMVWSICVEAAEHPGMILASWDISDEMPSESPDVFRKIGSRWAEEDAPAAWDFLQSRTTAVGRLTDPLVSGIIGVLSELMKTDREVGLEIARNFNDRSGAILAELYAGWLATNPDEAWAAALQETPKSSHEISLILRVTIALSATDPALAARLLAASPVQRFDTYSSWDMAGGLGRIASRWAKRDPVAATAFYRTLDRDVRAPFGHSLALAWIKSTDRSGWWWLNESGNGTLLSAYGGDMLSALASRDPTFAVSQWESAAPEQRQSWIGSLAAGFARNDPAGAFQWALGLSETSQQNKAAAVALPFWFSADWQGASDFLQARFGGAFPAREISMAWCAADPEFALRYVTQNEPESEHTSMLAELLPRAANQRPEAAAVASLSIDSPSRRQTTAIAISATWASQAPTDAFRWANSLEDSTLRYATVRAVIERWSEFNAADAARQLGSLSGTARDQAVVGLVHGTMNRSPALAADWAVSIADGANRLGALTSVMDRWFSADQIAAENWMARSLRPEMRAEILNRLPSLAARRYLLKNFDAVGNRSGDKTETLHRTARLPRQADH